MKEKNIRELAKRMGLITVENMCQYTIAQLVVMVANKVNELVDEVWRFETDVQEILKTQNEKIQYLLGEGLHLEVENIFDGWLQDGTFDTLINQTALKKVNERIDETNALLTDMVCNVKKFGAIGDGQTDDTVAIEQAVSSLLLKGGGTLYFPVGTYIVTRQINIKGVGIYIESENPYKTVIKASDCFKGESVIKFEKIDTFSTKGIGIRNGISINCNNQNCHGITVVKAYDQTIWDNVEVRNTHSDYRCFNFIQDDTNGVGQTLILNNCIGAHNDNNPSSPVFYFKNYQEIQLNGCKAFSSKPVNDVVFDKGDCYYFDGCRGVTINGCSVAFCYNGIVIDASDRACTGITIVGLTVEQCYNHLLKSKSSSNNVTKKVTLLPIRAQSNSGSISLERCQNSLIYADDVPVELLTSTYRNVVYISDKALVNSISNKGNTIFVTANYNTRGFAVNDCIEVLGNNTFINLHHNDKTMSIRNNASRVEVYNNDNNRIAYIGQTGVGFVDENGVQMLQVNNNPASGYSGVVMLVNRDGVKMPAHIRFGAPDSGGNGYRMLVVEN